MNESAKQLDAHANGSESIRVSGRMESPASAFEVHLTPTARWWRGGSTTPTGSVLWDAGGTAGSFEVALTEVRTKLGGRLRPETVEVKATKGAVPPKQLTALALEAVCASFDIAVPEDDALTKLRKLYREERKLEQEARAAAKAKNAERAVKQKVKERARRPQPSKPVRDVPSFLEAVHVRVRDGARLDKALSMLKADRFHLYGDVGSGQVVGVVKSQSDASLVYGCRLAEDGSFSCCTQNLNTCGGLRGQICKHILVLVVGLVQAEELDPAKTDAWIEASLDQKQTLDKDAMAEVFLRYKGAEAGDVDWRPTETIPEDFYTY